MDREACSPANLRQLLRNMVHDREYRYDGDFARRWVPASTVGERLVLPDLPGHMWICNGTHALPYFFPFPLTKLTHIPAIPPRGRSPVREVLSRNQHGLYADALCAWIRQAHLGHDSWRAFHHRLVLDSGLCHLRRHAQGGHAEGRGAERARGQR
jgi:hypothetical protein